MFLNSGICFHADSGRCFGFWQVFLNSRKCFGFWDVFWILASVFEFWDMFSCGFWEVFWILASIFEFKKVLWILGCVLDLGTCFVLRPVTVNLSNFRKKKKKRRPTDREDRNVEY